MQHKLTVIQLIPSLNVGGVERGTIELAKYLKDQGHRPIVISAGGQWLKLLVESGIEHICIPVGKKSLTNLVNIWRLKKIFQQLNADIVHARSRLPAWLALFAIKKMNTAKPAFVTTIHGLYSVKKYSSIMCRGDAVIAVSKTAAEYAKKNYPETLKKTPTIIYRGIDPTEFPYQYVPTAQWLDEWYSKYPETKNKWLVLLPGRLSALKGAESLFSWLESSSEYTHLILTADRNQSQYCKGLNDLITEKGFADKVSWVSDKQCIKSLYALSDVVVSCNKKAESFGRTVAEALAIGTPVAAYALGGVEEIMRSVFPEGLVKAGDSHALAERINGLLKQKPIVENRQPFQVADMLEKTLQVYCRLSQTDG